MKAANTIGEQVAELLRSVDSKLVKSYETNVLGSAKWKTIREALGEFERLKKEEHGRANRREYHIGFLFICGFTVAFSGLFFYINKESYGAAMLAVGVLSMILSLFFTWRSTCDSEANRLNISEIRDLLEDFKSSLEALDSPIGQTIWQYNEDSVDRVLDQYIFNILSSEEKLDQIRFQKNRDIDGMIRYSNYILKMREGLAMTLESAKDFGIEPDITAMFRKADGQIKKMAQNSS